MRNFIYTLGLTGVVIGYAAYKMAKNLDTREEENEEEKMRKENALSKTKKFNSIMMCCQLNSLMENEGVSYKQYEGSASVGQLKRDLPKEIVHRILSYCDVSDLCKTKIVCTAWKDFSEFILKDKSYLRKCAMRGINKEHRGRFWLMVSNCSNEGVQEKMYLKIKKAQTSEEKELSDRAKLRDIKKDISRTMKENFTIKNMKEKEAILKKILSKFCSHDDEVGYVQGMNFLVVHINEHLDEEQSYLFLKTIMFEYDLRSNYFKHLPRLKLSFYQLECYIKKYLPRLYRRFRRINIKMTMFASEWFLTLFTYRFPLYFTQPIWDLFLIDGYVFLISISLALLAKEQNVSFDLTLNRLKNINVEAADVNKLIERAYLFDVSSADLDLFQRKFVDMKLFLKY